MNHPAQRVLAELAAHRDAACSGRLLLLRCTACATWAGLLRHRCPACGGAVAWAEASLDGEVESFTVVRRAPGPEQRDAVPYTLAAVRLHAGVRLVVRLDDVAAGAVRMGLPVSLRPEACQDGGGLVWTASATESAVP